MKQIARKLKSAMTQTPSEANKAFKHATQHMADTITRHYFTKKKEYMKK